MVLILFLNKIYFYPNVFLVFCLLSDLFNIILKLLLLLSLRFTVPLAFFIYSLEFI